MRRATDDHKQPNAMTNDRFQLVRLVANPAIVGDGNPSALTHSSQPFLIGAVMREMIDMPLYGQLRVPENLAEPLAKIPVREEDSRHPARS